MPAEAIDCQLPDDFATVISRPGEAIGVPLNDEAMAVLCGEEGKHPERVFTYKGRPLGQVFMATSKANRM